MPPEWKSWLSFTREHPPSPEVWLLPFAAAPCGWRSQTVDVDDVIGAAGQFGISEDDCGEGKEDPRERRPCKGGKSFAFHFIRLVAQLGCPLQVLVVTATLSRPHLQWHTESPPKVALPVATICIRASYTTAHRHCV